MEPETKLMHEEVKQTEERWNKFIEDNNVTEMSKYMTEDWVIVGQGGITSKETFLNLVKNGDLVHTRMDFEIVRVEVYGNTSIVTQRGTSAGTYKERPFSNYEWATSILVKGHEGWLAVYTMIAPADCEQ